MEKGKKKEKTGGEVSTIDKNDPEKGENEPRIDKNDPENAIQSTIY